MRIPDIRSEMHNIANMIGGPVGSRLRYLAEETRRRKPLRRAPPRREPRVTRAQIARFFARYPLANNQDAAAHFNVNTRAISYAYRGQRR